MLKRFVVTVSVLAALASPALAVGPTLCDKSTLCHGLVSLHEFEEASDVAREDSFNGANFFLEPDGLNVGNAAGKTGTNAVNLSGSNYLKFRFTGGFGNGRYTIALWVYAANGTPAQKSSLYSNDRANQRGGDIFIEYATTTTYTPKFTVYQTDDTAKTVAWGSAISTNAWHLILVEVEGNTFTSSDGKIYISVDGGARVSTALSNFLRGAVYETDVGRRPTGTGDQYFTGRIDQLAQWARLLSPAEITLLYNGTPPNGVGQAFPFNTN